MMEAFLKRLQTLPEVRELTQRMESGGCPAAVTGLQPVQRCCVGASAALGAGRPAVFICAGEREARQLAADLRSLLGEEPVLLPEREWELRPDATVSREWERERLAALYRLASGGAKTLVCTPDALMARTLPPDSLRKLSAELKPGDRADLNGLSQRLLAAGYTRCAEVEGPGQFAVRGGILDVYSPMADLPVRCEFFDDEIDSMGFFDPDTQRRTENAPSVLLLPAAEVLPSCAAGGPDGGTGSAADGSGALECLAETLEKLSRRCGKKRPTLGEVLRNDAEQLRTGVLPGGLDRYLAAVYPGNSSGLDYLSPDAAVFLCETGRIDERIHGMLTQFKQDAEILLEAGYLAGEYAKLYLTAEEFYSALSEFPVVMANSLPTSRYPLRPRGILNMNVRQLSSYGGSLETAAQDLEQYRKSGYGVLVLCGGDVRARNLHQLLEDRGIHAALSLRGDAVPAAGQVLITLGPLSAGCEWPYLKLAVLTEGQLTAGTGRPPRRGRRYGGAEADRADGGGAEADEGDAGGTDGRPAAGKSGGTRRPTNRQKLRSYADLFPGDLVVHEHHGIGRFVKILKMPVDGVEKDYIQISYAGGDMLYVPATQLDQVSKYIGSAGGGDESAPARLNKLGGTDWTKQKTRAKKAVRDLAKGLTKLYAERQRLPGFAFSSDSPWQREFEDAFPYEETEDQLRAIADIKADMERPRPMDRLLCGDVGYGKTEVALRAVMKCVLDGKQAAILVPTTVLAQQHYATAVARFQDFPVKIETLSRFTSPKESKRILNAARLGGLDVLIGTHRLLSKNMEFRNLGLLVIDEEQRFGVTHKERLKELSRQVDVLTLSATPIPRTLNMALSGLRDMSTIEEPPQGRQPVQTYVLEHDWGLLADALRRELDRGGQAYYLHNRVESIDQAAAHVQKLLPEARIVVGHGKMPPAELEKVMRRMADGEADILICTTIIETGIDIPNVNTLIIEDADRMGLAQLHQIRGRIGRSARRAYAYLTFRQGKILQENAERRLSAIREYVEFGSGFKIAMRDLEIRGAGNLLGPEQSGYLMTVGYDLYLKLLEEAVLEEQGKEKPLECAADLTVSANIPAQYVPSAEQRMDLYRRIAAIRTEEDASDLLDELIDRYGEAPKPVLALLDVALLRTAAAVEGVRDISQRGDEVRLTMAAFDAPAVLGLCALGKYQRRLSLSAGETPVLKLKLARNADPLDAARELVEDLRLAGQRAKQG